MAKAVRQLLAKSKNLSNLTNYFDSVACVVKDSFARGWLV